MSARPHQRLYAGVCWRMLAYADVCWRMLTYADVCRLGTCYSSSFYARMLFGEYIVAECWFAPTLAPDVCPQPACLYCITSFTAALLALWPHYLIYYCISSFTTAFVPLLVHYYLYYCIPSFTSHCSSWYIHTYIHTYISCMYIWLIDRCVYWHSYI